MGNLKNALRVLSVGVALSAPIQGRAQEQMGVGAIRLPGRKTVTLDEFQKMSDTLYAEQHKERSDTVAGNEWVTRVPVGNGWRTEPITSLDETLKNPALKDHIYLAGVGGYQTPLAYGVVNNDIGLIDKCLAAGVNPDVGRIGVAPGPDSPLAKAVNNYSRFKKEGRDVSIQAREIEALLKAGANPDITTSEKVVSNEPGRWRSGEGDTPLHVMAELRDDKMIDLLVSHGADVSAKREGRTPLDVYNADITAVSGGKLPWRGEKKAETVSKLTPKSSGFSLTGWLSRSGGR